MRGAPAAAPGSWTRQVEDLVRALSGAFLFAIPLLFTMEMWWLGEHTATWKLLLVLGIALAANYALARATGFKARQLSGGGPGRPGEHLEQAVSALAVGILAAGIVLVALNRIELDDPLDTILGKIVMQTLPLSLGASVANAVFARGASRAGDDSGGADSGGGRDHGDRGGHDRDGSRTRGPARGKPAPHWQEVLSDIGATATGGIFLGFSVAPTDEIPMLAAGLDLRHQLAVVLLTLANTIA
jgi:putative integral membrane protein (TIGR02587 family)